MSAYLILDVEIHDIEKYGEYMKLAKPLVDKYGGIYHVRGGPFEIMDGDWKPTRLVVIEYPDMKTAKDIFALLKNLKKPNRLIIFATHNRFFAKKADYLLEMTNGSVKTTNV